MPFEIIRRDITTMSVDAIVIAANPQSMHGTDAEFYAKAGPALLAVRKIIGAIKPGDVKVTPGFRLPAKHVIHTAAPVQRNGTQGGAALLQQCYARSLALAYRRKYRSVAFPLIAAENCGFSKAMALKIAVDTIREFLQDHDMLVYLAMPDNDTCGLPGSLITSIRRFLDAHYIEEQTDTNASAIVVYDDSVFASAPEEDCSLADMLEDLELGFSDTLLNYIDRTGKKDSDIYKKANVDRKLFSKIRNNPHYKPSKATALAFAIALELDLDETKNFIGRAGYALSRSSKFDVIIEYFILRGVYDIHEINMTLFEFDQSLLGA